jgi:hypothetical protein
LERYDSRLEACLMAEEFAHRLNSTTVLTDHRMVRMRVKRYIAVVVDTEGVTSRYVFTARSRRRAKREAREWAERTEWGATLLRITPAVDEGLGAKGLRLLRVAAITLVACGTAITAMMIIGLGLEGAL